MKMTIMKGSIENINDCEDALVNGFIWFVLDSTEFIKLDVIKEGEIALWR